jgi:hypothetical protein
MNQNRNTTIYNPFLTVLFLAFTSLAGSHVLAAGGTSGFNYSVSPSLFDTELVPKSDTELKEARLNSGLGISLSGDDLFKISMSYKMQGRLVNKDSQVSSVDQMLDASMHSKLLDELFDIKAGIRANSIVRKGGENYSYKISPSFSKSLKDVAKLNVKYNYERKKPSPHESPKETRGYTLGLKGDLEFGNIRWTSAYSEGSVVRELADESKEIRDLTLKFIGKFDREKISWKSAYSKSSVENDILTPAEGIEMFSVQSRYEIVPQMHLELSTSKKRKTLESTINQRNGHEIHHAAGITWSPSKVYSLAFNVNKFDSTALQKQDYYSSGKIVWFPQNNVELSLGYGDKLLENSRGLVISATLDLDKNSALHTR